MAPWVVLAPCAPMTPFRSSIRRVAETIALDLLTRDGIAVIWKLHLAAAQAYRYRRRRAANILMEIADAAEDAWRRLKEEQLASLTRKPW
jgi:hypothetical protein